MTAQEVIDRKRLSPVEGGFASMNLD